MNTHPIFNRRTLLWEPILGIRFKRCTITHSILKGDDFCAWDYHW